MLQIVIDELAELSSLELRVQQLLHYTIIFPSTKIKRIANIPEYHSPIIVKKCDCDIPNQ